MYIHSADSWKRLRSELTDAGELDPGGLGGVDFAAVPADTVVRRLAISACNACQLSYICITWSIPADLSLPRNQHTVDKQLFNLIFGGSGEVSFVVLVCLGGETKLLHTKHTGQNCTKI